MSSKSKSSAINEQILKIRLIKKSKITYLIFKVIGTAPVKWGFEILVTMAKLDDTAHGSLPVNTVRITTESLISILF